MTEPSDSSPEHKRRPRYRGTHPRRFDEKYKELAPERYPEMIEHVRARGMTPAGQHVPILVEEILEVLSPQPGERGVDGTLGFGGHAERLLERIQPDGELLALDVDPLEIVRTEARLRALGHDETTLRVRRTNFAGMRAALHAIGWADGADFVLVDLGVSSMQIDDPARGFTFKRDGPLDMRMNPSRGVSAAQWLERSSVAGIARALTDNSDEPHANRVAEALVALKGRLRTTRELSDAIRAAMPTRNDEDEADRRVRRVFQALRIEVNDELGALDALLRALPECLRAGGRVAVLTFHSGEDRRVKKAFESGLESGVYAEIAHDVVRASPQEQHANPRSSSAKLRWARKAH